ncbi:GNAT family N-acetyltransferase [Actinoplanes palleronii]|uniref:N-acetyltransferase domain-containing protein n=1 Tax=Actinoplanes palleronii TaxID=113570 RepID=A0ABQ4BKF3_9ACTN|nr:GNAT family N-acetyltransferase [Actinoplanes palleronii]GIE71162.1 hypothetical protein Apa02nite_072700 [Actinoplanes palleronii]
MGTTADRLAAAYFDAIATLCTVTPKGWYAERGTARAALTGASLATLNCVYDTTLDPDPESLEELAADVSDRTADWSIMIRGAASPELIALAARHGLTRHGDVPLLGCAIGDVEFRDDERRVSVRRIGAAESDLYTQVLAEGFEAPAAAFGSLMGGTVLDAGPVTGYLAESGGHPIGTGLAMTSGDVVGVFNIAVRPAARSLGAGRRITEAVLHGALVSGATWAYLHPSEMARPLYESMGFHLVETWTAFTA